MKSEWPSVRLGDCCLKIGSGATPRGGQKSYLDDGPVALIRSQNVYNAGFQPEGLAYISDDQAAQLDNVVVELGDVLVNITGDSVARVCSAPPEVLPARVNQHVAIVRPRPDLFDARYLRYFFVSPHQQALLLSMAGGGGTRKALTKGMLENLRIPMPPIRIQRNIVEPLELIDRAIAVYRSKNATLQSVAETVFKSWFIDFDPVQSKAAGQEPLRMGAETAALFPSEFEESELGSIPKGWSPGRLRDLAHVVRNSVSPLRTPDAVFEHYSIPAYDSGEMPVREKGSEIKSNKYVVHPGTVLQSRLNPRIPRVWLPPGDPGDNAVCSTEFLVWQPLAAVPREYVYCLLTSPVVWGMVEALVTGTSGSHQRVRPEHVVDLEVVIPPSDVLTAFGRLVTPLFDRIIHNREQMQTLANLRDTLLPRLISGRLRIPEAEEIVEEAVS